MTTLSLVVMLFASSAAAQNAATPQIEKQGQQPAQQQTEHKRAVQTSEQPAPIAKPARIPYERILKNPDDVDLNFHFAQQQVHDGDLKGAAATLQRVLMIDPDLAKVRLLLAVVLYRLDDLAESERELKRLRETQIPSEARLEIDKYLAAIAKRRKKTHLDGTLTVGVEYDDNRNAQPASNQFLLADTPINAAGHRQDDFALLTMVGAGATHDLTTHNQLFADLNYYRADQSVVKTLDLVAYSASAGDTYRTPWGFTVKPSGLFNHVLLGQGTFLREEGGDLRLEKKLDRQDQLFLDASEVYDDYRPTASIPIADELRGAHAEARFGVQRVLSPTMRLDASAGYAHQNAAEAFWAYDRYIVNLTHTWLLPKGMFLLSSGELHFDYYEKPDAAVSARTRQDNTGRFDFTCGAPLAMVHPALKDLVATLTYDYYTAFSNVENYAFTNNKLAALLTYKWGLGL